MSCRREARRIEELRRGLLDAARGYGFELVMPPLLEHIESLLSGTGRELDLQTFKLVDQLSGRTLGLRADTTPQVARIDAHLLNRSGVARLCYCGPVLHTRPTGSQRQPRAAAVRRRDLRPRRPRSRPRDPATWRSTACSVVGLTDADARPGRCAHRARACSPACRSMRPRSTRSHAALAAKDAAGCASVDRGFPAEARRGLRGAAALYGDADVLDAARARPAGAAADRRRARRPAAGSPSMLRQAHPDVQIGFDLADLSGYAYYSGARFAVYAEGASDALARGGRYDEVGAVVRPQPAGGRLQPRPEGAGRARAAGVGRAPAIRAPWGEDAALRARRPPPARTGRDRRAACCPGTSTKARSSTATASWSPLDGRWALRPL